MTAEDACAIPADMQNKKQNGAAKASCQEAQAGVEVCELLLKHSSAGGEKTLFTARLFINIIGSFFRLSPAFKIAVNQLYKAQSLKKSWEEEEHAQQIAGEGQCLLQMCAEGKHSQAVLTVSHLCWIQTENSSQDQQCLYHQCCHKRLPGQMDICDLNWQGPSCQGYSFPSANCFQQSDSSDTRLFFHLKQLSGCCCTCVLSLCAWWHPRKPPAFGA
nr:uncharacterized protein LOC112546296 [Pelodiscus sinensis]|eukprot:XP_025041966.1 uncharacterized protein LOC112546296 [Pelodiscus sinensis]